MTLLIHLDVDRLVEFAALGSKQQTPKTKKRKIKLDLSIDNLQYLDFNSGKRDATDADETKLLELVQRDLVVDGEFDLQFHDFGPLDEVAPRVYQFVTSDIKVAKEDGEQLLEVKNIRMAKFASETLLSINLTGLDGAIADEIQLLRATTLKLERNKLQVTPAKLTISFDCNNNKVDVSLSYSIHIVCDIHRTSLPEVSQNIANIVNHWTNSQSNYVPVSTLTFYGTITEHTAKIPAVKEDFDIPELETKLLPFQKKTLKWLLHHENVQFDPVTSRCTRNVLINKETADLFSNYLATTEADVIDIDSRALDILNRLWFGWTTIQKHTSTYYYNRLTGNLISREDAVRYLHNYYHHTDRTLYPQYLPGKALLAEEMGLGKTVEITTLVLMNQRPMEEINSSLQVQLLSVGDMKTVIKAKTTLIIAPDSILKQWVEEIVHLAPSLAVTVYGGMNKYSNFNSNPILIAEYLRRFDVVFTTYSVISMELDYALYSSKSRRTRNSNRRSADEGDEEVEPEREKSSLLEEYQYLFQLAPQLQKPKNANIKTDVEQEDTDYEKALQDEINKAIRHNKHPSVHRNFDYESPLMLTQFWRVILDEVQMVSSKYSRAFQSAALIPRFHAWGVSGTPIKKGIHDLHSVLQFLEYQPFCGDRGKNSWELLVGSQEDFSKLWNKIAIRHTKAMVHDDIKLPPQNRVLLSIPFTPIEQDYYNQILEECLSYIGLDVDGNPNTEDWEPRPIIMTYMRQWLVKLRQMCCNPQIGKLNFGSKKYKKSYLNTIGFSGAVNQLKTLEALLDDMLTRAYSDIIDMERQLIQLYVLVGEFYEFIYEPQRALEYLLPGAAKTEEIIHRLKLILQKYIEDYKMHSSRLNLKLEDDDHIGNLESKEKALVKDEVLEKLEEKIKSTRLRIRNWYIMLHRFYFLTASSYFQTYDEEYGKIIEQYKLPAEAIPKDEQLIKLKEDNEGDRSNEISSLVNGVVLEKFQYVRPDPLVDFKMEADEHDGIHAKHKYLELKYYDMAETTRREILSSTILNVEDTVKSRITSRVLFSDDSAPLVDEGLTLLPKNSKKLFMAVPKIEIELSDFTASIRLKLLVDKLRRVVDLLNHQGESLNMWMKELVEVLRKPLLSHDKNPDGEEYEESIQDQDKASSFLFVLGQVLTDRTECLEGIERSDKIVSIKTLQEKRAAEAELQKVNDRDFLFELQNVRNEVRPKTKLSLLELLTEMREVENELEEDKESVELEILEHLSQRMRTIFDNQKLSLVLLQKELSNSCNVVFNARIEYFKQLQQISDSVKTSNFLMDRKNLTRREVATEFTVFGLTYRGHHMKMDKAIAKFRYLRGLVGSEDEINKEDDLMCIICRSTITIGSLTQCGHKYCKDCLEHWLQNRHSCPMCKAPLAPSSVYNFTHHKPNLNAKKVEEEKVDGKSVGLYSIYHPIPKTVIDEIQLIKLKDSFSSKVDLIVKQVLYLKSQDPLVQIVVFSQWQDMLYILGTAFKTAGISYLASYGTLTPEVGGGRRHKKYDSVETFKDPANNITCFLLNAKAQSAGLTLINATHIFLCEPLVNTSIELQAISRIHRIGQTKTTTVWMFAIENTVEESIVITSTNKRLKYLEGDSSVVGGQVIGEERDLTKAESMTFINSDGIDALVDKGTSQGESVTNLDLWNAFFSARSQKRLVITEEETNKS